jgi:hypothetical protein
VAAVGRSLLNKLSPMPYVHWGCPPAIIYQLNKLPVVQQLLTDAAAVGLKVLSTMRCLD